jgi:hypothetical protein
MSDAFEDAQRRATRYRLLAEDAEARAEAATTEKMREAFAALAAGWRQLALETSRKD